MDHADSADSRGNRVIFADRARNDRREDERRRSLFYRRLYGKRRVRYVYMDHGHAAQNVSLQAVALDLGTVVIGAFDDDALGRVMSLSPEEEPLSIMPVGRLRGR